jgi:hypothetical protein
MFKSTPFWAVKSIHKQFSIFEDTHIYAVELCRPDFEYIEEKKELDNIVEVGQFQIILFYDTNIVTEEEGRINSEIEEFIYESMVKLVNKEFWQVA